MRFTLPAGGYLILFVDSYIIRSFVSVMKSKTISIIFSLMLLTSLTYLATEEYLQKNSTENQTWWTVYFENPKGNSLDTTIENRAEGADFRWEIYLEKNLVGNGDARIESGQKKTIPITSTALSGRKITIRIFKGDEKRELYKIIE